MRQKEYIASLLEKFLEGQSTEAEEQTLSEYFDSADDVPAEWVAYQELFRSFTTDAYDFSNEEIDAMLAPTPSKKGDCGELATMECSGLCDNSRTGRSVAVL